MTLADYAERAHECLCNSEAWRGHLGQTGPFASLTPNALARRQAIAALLAAVAEEAAREQREKDAALCDARAAEADHLKQREAEAKACAAAIRAQEGA